MISYAQNLEDVVLNRVFQNKPNGFYIDVGAHDPVELSVTKHFYDLGWRGINIEPVPSSFEKFKKERPDDINLNIAVGSAHDFTTIYEIEGRPDLTTLDKDIAKSASAQIKANIRPHTVEIRTLTEICEQYCHGFIDFMKIDVEGFEKEVILGTDLKRFRPTMLVVEATKPCEAIINDWDHPEKAASWYDWESLLIEVEYLLVYYDGLNRFYLRKEDEHLKNRFAIPVTWLQDQFSLYHDVRETWRLDAGRKRLEEEKATLSNQLDVLANQRSNLLKERDQLKSRETELVVENEALETARVRLVEENSSRQVLISELKKQEEALRKKQDELIAESEGQRKLQSALQGELEDKHRELNMLKAVLEEERFVRRRNPVQRFFAYFKPLFGIKSLHHLPTAVANAKPKESASPSPYLMEAKWPLEVSDLMVRIRRLRREFDAVRKSKRWQVGNRLVRIIEVLLLRPKVPLAIDQIESVFGEIMEEQSFLDKHSLMVRIRGLRREFDAVLKSKRWQVGNRLMRIIEVLLLRPKVPLATDQIESIFREIEEREVSNKSQEIPKPKTHEHSVTKQSKKASGTQNIPPFNGVDELNKILNDIRFETGQNEVYFMPCVDTELPVMKIEPQEPWIGIVHTPGGIIPEWWAQVTDGMFISNQSLLNTSAWELSKNTCQGLITFSKSHAEKLKLMIDTPVESVLHPLPDPNIKWTPSAFKENKERKIIQWGWWMRRIHAIHMLWESSFTRVFIKDFDKTAQDVFAAERNELSKQNLFFDFMEDGIVTIESLQKTKRLEMLQGNIAFIHYYAASAPAAVLDCIATHTPILVNALPSIIEYLGEDYPLYYHFYADAIEKAQNDALVLKAHEHLRCVSSKKEFSAGYFKQAIKDFCQLKEQA